MFDNETYEKLLVFNLEKYMGNEEQVKVLAGTLNRLIVNEAYRDGWNDGYDMATSEGEF